MDIFAHTLWTNAAARGANKLSDKKGKKFHINVAWTAFFGVFPDLFAFTIPFVIRFYKTIFGGENFLEFHGVQGDGFDLAHNLYNYSHSLVILTSVFLIVWIIYKRPRYELLGWALHILIDIPSHVISFYPTPFLFPISGYRFPYGVQWSNQWYMIINYCALLVVWLRIFYKKYKNKGIDKNSQTA